ncbi:hypothetical protein ACOSQ2_019114 [Xanthoceras sorbifolium]
MMILDRSSGYKFEKGIRERFARRQINWEGPSETVSKNAGGKIGGFRFMVLANEKSERVVDASSSGNAKVHNDTKMKKKEVLVEISNLVEKKTKSKGHS